MGGPFNLLVSPTPPDAKTTILRRFDPNALAIYFNEDMIALQPCWEEMKQLNEKIEAAYRRLEVERCESPT
jgi:hypothetical protein